MSGRPRLAGACPLEGRVSPRPVPALNDDARRVKLDAGLHWLRPYADRGPDATFECAPTAATRRSSTTPRISECPAQHGGAERQPPPDLAALRGCRARSRDRRMERLRDPARAGGESGGIRLGVRVEEKGWAACDLKTSAKSEATLGETRRNNLRCSRQQAPATAVFRGERSTRVESEG